MADLKVKNKESRRRLANTPSRVFDITADGLQDVPSSPPTGSARSGDKYYLALRKPAALIRQPDEEQPPSWLGGGTYKSWETYQWSA